MYAHAFHTPILQPGDDIFQTIATAILDIPERSFLVVASKIVATVENRFVPKTTEDKEEKHNLVKQEAEYYLDAHSSKYNMMLTMKRNWIFVNAGIDESNANGQYLLWPKDPQKSVNEIWKFVREHYGVKEVGVTMSDSISMPLNWGVIGHAIAHCGFHPLKNYIDTSDLFGRKMVMEQVNIMQSITAAAALEMGEGNESTPLSLVEGVQHVEWHDHVPTEAELAALKINIEDDAYAPILTKAEWKKGGA